MPRFPRGPENRVQFGNRLSWKRSELWTRWVARDFAELGQDTILLRPCWFWGTADIRIGKQVQVGQISRIGALNGARISIGDGCEIVGGLSMFAQTEGIEIGRYVLMAWNVQIYDSQHRISDPDVPIRLQGMDRGGKVTIGDGAWLGANVVVMQGVTIGHGAVVGANSVVTKDVPPLAIVAGTPARLIRMRPEAEAEAEA